MARYVPNRRETGRWLRSSRDLQRVSVQVAEEIAGVARATAPVDSGDYVASIQVREERGWDGRVGAVVEATAAHSAAVEFGNRRVKAQGVLQQATEAVAAFGGGT